MGRQTDGERCADRDNDVEKGVQTAGERCRQTDGDSEQTEKRSDRQTKVGMQTGGERWVVRQIFLSPPPHFVYFY